MIGNFKPCVRLGDLSGPEGNAYCSLGRCEQMAKVAGWTDEQIKEFVTEAKSSDYDHLLDTIRESFDWRDDPKGGDQDEPT